MKLFLLFCILFSLTYAKTTKDFSIIIHKPFNAALFDITEDYDRTITATGFASEFRRPSKHLGVYTDAFDYLSNVSNKYGAQMSLIKVDNRAKILLSKHAKPSRFNKAIAVIKTPTNGYFIGGYTIDGFLIIAKLDAHANILYSKVFGTKNYDRMSSLIPLSDGGLLAVGSSFTSRATTDNMFQSGLGNDDIFITRFSQDGHILWSKKYGTRFDDNGIDAVEAQDGSIVIISTMSSPKSREVSFMRITENGNKIWLNHFITQHHNENLVIPKKIIRLKDNSFVVSLIQYNQVQKEHIRLVKFDLHKNILADKEISTTYPSGLMDIKEFSNGMLMGVGYVKDKHNTDGLAMLIDSDLTMLKQEHYGGENFDIFYALSILHNSQVAVAGIHTDDYSQEGNMWILKLNHDATLAQVSTLEGNFYDALCKIFEKEIQAKKLRIKEDLSIEFTEKSLYFAAGKYSLTQAQKNFLRSFSKKLLAFLYTNKEQVATLAINGHTSSEWKNVNFKEQYLSNEDLSMKRSFSVLRELFTTQNESKQKWLSNILEGNGLSFSHTITNNGFEDKTRSRRVTLKVILK